MTPGDTAAGCPDCREPVPAGARYCPHCGAGVQGGDHTLELLPERQAPSRDTLALRTRTPMEFPPELHAAHRRVVGLEPAPLLASLSAAMWVVTIILFVTGGWIAGIVCLGLATALVTLLVSAVRREPHSRLGRRAAAARHRLTAWGRLTAVAVRASARAALELSRLRVRRRLLRRRLDEQLRPLGDAVLRDQLGVADALKSRAAETELELKAAERRAAEVVGAARDEVGRERAHLQPTRMLPVIDDAADGPGPAQAD
jgi:hypothetical protein